MEFDAWLISINTQLTQMQVLHSRRFEYALKELERLTGEKIASEDPRYKSILEFFGKNARIQGPSIGPKAAGLYYHDDCFWKMVVPTIFGRVKAHPTDWLMDVPKSIRFGIKHSNRHFMDYAKVWADCFDFAYGTDDFLRRRQPNNFGEKLLSSGKQFLDATVSMLLEPNPNSGAFLQSRMASEMFLKAFIYFNDGNKLDANQAKNIGHKLVEALKKCQSLPKSGEFRYVSNLDGLYPAISDRYEGQKYGNQSLWDGYKAAVFIGATLTRSITDRNTQYLFAIQDGVECSIPIRQ
jgi:hypothetical protein